SSTRTCHQPATPDIYPLSLHDALPICHVPRTQVPAPDDRAGTVSGRVARTVALRQAGTPGGAAAAHPELVRQVSTGETDYRVRRAMTASRHRRPRVSRRPISAGHRPTVPWPYGANR